MYCTPKYGGRPVAMYPVGGAGMVKEGSVDEPPRGGGVVEVEDLGWPLIGVTTTNLDQGVGALVGKYSRCL